MRFCSMPSMPYFGTSEPLWHRQGSMCCNQWHSASQLPKDRCPTDHTSSGAERGVGKSSASLAAGIPSSWRKIIIPTIGTKKNLTVINLAFGAWKKERLSSTVACSTRWHQHNLILGSFFGRVLGSLESQTTNFNSAWENRKPHNALGFGSCIIRSGHLPTLWRIWSNQMSNVSTHWIPLRQLFAEKDYLFRLLLIEHDRTNPFSLILNVPPPPINKHLR